MSIALNSLSKFKTRLLPTMKDYQARKGEWPSRITCSLAALLLLYRGSYQGQEIPLRDAPQHLDFFKKQWTTYEEQNNLSQLVEALLTQADFWGEDLSQLEGLGSAVQTQLSQLLEQGIVASLKEL